jgi:hypothetical protein
MALHDTYSVAALSKLEGSLSMIEDISATQVGNFLGG